MATKVTRKTQFRSTMCASCIRIATSEVRQTFDSRCAMGLMTWPAWQITLKSPKMTLRLVQTPGPASLPPNSTQWFFVFPPKNLSSSYNCQKIRVRGIEPRAAAELANEIEHYMRGGNVSRYTIPDPTKVPCTPLRAVE
jgi:hypothetical protein